ncbi:hypothetical protein CEUSTIGMA_g410.t1 [Chlamydomonas eustigma]|uniref:Uncharacterized protein n=1 Tax=Chlamydomonas eustigma TaxID=1157962 RepID=A0A250WQ27_9CHLO|nr:hypothetical protein CEUSTIGMA_g410.t1 [Chlamydomonas eustigma]|eukprot:GAX72955.1 hypothetical protein CEUSTIGMA_g410.t1 [Chlamydomonas eustigma]
MVFPAIFLVTSALLVVVAKINARVGTVSYAEDASMESTRSLHAAKMIGSVELIMNRTKTDLAQQTRPCKGIDAVKIVTEMRIAQISGCNKGDVAVTHIGCDLSGVNMTISFVNLSGQVNGYHAISSGVEHIQKVLADPLTSQYGLSLIRIVAHRLVKDAHTDSEQTNGLIKGNGTLLGQTQLA